jgi:hypothetical protein
LDLSSTSAHVYLIKPTYVTIYIHVSIQLWVIYYFLSLRSNLMITFSVMNLIYIVFWFIMHQLHLYYQDGSYYKAYVVLNTMHWINKLILLVSVIITIYNHIHKYRYILLFVNKWYLAEISTWQSLNTYYNNYITWICRKIDETFCIDSFYRHNSSLTRKQYIIDKKYVILSSYITM